MVKSQKTARDIFNQWAKNDHASGMERSHRESVEQAFGLISPSEGNYLEIGFGNGYGIEMMAGHQYRNGRCYGLDVSREMVQLATARLGHLPNISLESGDFLRWQPPVSALFTCIFSMEVFYYFLNLQTGIEKAASLLKPGGMLMVLVNYYQENELSHSWPSDLDVPMTLWSSCQYLEGFAKAGLRSLEQFYFDNATDNMRTLCTMGRK